MLHASAGGSLVANATRAARLRFWIVAIGAFALSAIAASTAYDSWRHYWHVIASNQHELANLANALAEQTGGTLQASDLVLRDIATWYEADHPAPTHASQTQLAEKISGLPQVLAAAITDERGHFRIRSRTGPTTTQDISSRTYFTAHHDHRGLGALLGEPFVTRVDRHPAIMLSRRLERPDGKFDGIVQVEVDLVEMQRVFSAIDLGRGSAINLLDDDGTLIVRQPPAPNAIGNKFGGFVAADSVTSGDVVDPIDRAPSFAGLAHVAGFPLRIVLTRDKDVALAIWAAETPRVAVRTGLLVLLGALAVTALVHQLRRIELGERALRQSEERYALAMEGANEGHFDWFFDGTPSFVSAHMKRLHGRTADAPVSTRAAWLSELEIHPDDLEKVDSALRNHLAGDAGHYEVEYRVRHADRQWHWLHARGRCYRDDRGELWRFVGSTIDITERKAAEAEKEALAIQLRQSQKLEAMGTLAGGIAHDFNNILGAILGYGELAQNAAGDRSVMRHYIDNVMQAAGRAKSLVERILAFSRSGVGERHPVNVQMIVGESLEILAASLPSAVRLEASLDAADAAVVGDATQLHQVAMNLCTNAMQAMNRGGVLSVALDVVHTIDGQRLSHGNLIAGSYVRLCVGDTGIGIPDHVLERMFDPFFTTKGVGEGTGLGLSLVHGIVADLNGVIDVTTVVGQGTQFRIWLPLATERMSPPADDLVEVPRGTGQTIMIVDDETALVAIAEEMLASIGYEPVGFTSSTQALATFSDAPLRFDVVLTDEAMPGLVGTELARRIRVLRPDIPVAIMTGHSDAPFLEGARAGQIDEILSKPLRGKEIARSIDRMLRRYKRSNMAST